jgi:hypothetical protein
MADNIQEQIVREAPDIEQAKVGLMSSAKSLADSANLNALSGQYLTPDYQVAGMSPDQLSALSLGRQGIGAYQPYMTAATQGVTAGGNTIGEAAGILRGADTRGQFAGAQAAMNQAAIPIQQLGGVAQTVGDAQGLARQYAQANMGQSMNTLGQGIGALSGAAQMYNPTGVQNFMNPFQQQVIDESVKQINRQGDIAQQGLQAQAVKSGAFGGSRDAIQRAELQRNTADQRNAAIVGGLSTGYQNAAQQAQQAFEQQQARQLQQAQGYQGFGGLYGQQALQQAQLGQGAAGLIGNLGGQQANIYGQQSQLGQSLGQGIGSLASQQFGIGAQMAQGLGSLGSQQANIGMQQAALGQNAQAMGQQDTNFLYNLGTAQQKQLQSELDATRQNTVNKNMQPYQQLAFVSDIYKGAPSSQMGVTTASQPTPSPFQQAAGLATGVVSTAAAARMAGVP